MKLAIEPLSPEEAPVVVSLEKGMNRVAVIATRAHQRAVLLTLHEDGWVSLGNSELLATFGFHRASNGNLQVF